MYNRENKQRGDELKRQRETEIELMRMARQEAIEEEERMESGEKQEALLEASEDEVDSAVLNEAVDKLRPPPPHSELIPLSE